MTNKEAIRIINGKAPLIIRDREGGICDKTDELKTTILSALEKQIPKEPIGVYDSFGDIAESCPSCKVPIVNVWNKAEYRPKYCHYCGQAIDWGDTDA